MHYRIRKLSWGKDICIFLDDYSILFKKKKGSYQFEKMERSLKVVCESVLLYVTLVAIIYVF